jgi:hypothetical protein
MLVNTESQQVKIKYLAQDLRMWRDKNDKLDLAMKKDSETRDA